MKIYYATSIRGAASPESLEINNKLIQHLKKYGTVLTEHFTNPDIFREGESEIPDAEIHDRDMEWIMQSDIIVAEVSNPSLGVGYEIGRAIENGKKILCIFRKQQKKLSAMIRGSSILTVKDYDDIKDAFIIIDEFFRGVEI